MSHVGIVLISHSSKVVEGIKDIINQMVPNVVVEPAGGTEDHGIGTSVEKILQAIENAYSEKGVLLFYDIGSAMMNAELAIELSEHENIEIANAPILEGAFVASVESGMGKTLEEVKQAAEKAVK
ncbi:dihydroxyacetone kinase phosphoryl donor subunit DhaM [Ornithinibacillus bavariensis]|uniref:phosphoenolpyruvate--glycerone phosphotransferase n=1 Tax=Ornithinibacillus bavariensis TaxID=545502 RepID=A0A919X975_9BACI|nr:dihydroxyacetone kinase phosphoryl donor subunit DhaM [Ornithinibacillus bavariensis]GIO27901.1 PTS-dependent dihydroxyacetone kinase phosphotransferase subunit DhaM [Ornithinibacillus bavariensis]